MKATVDAYDGTVTLYEWDEEDPVLETYMKAFPGTVQPTSEIADELISHVRYPEDLFKLQRDILTRYHVDDPVRLLQARTTAGRSRPTRRRTPRRRSRRTTSWPSGRATTARRSS